MTNGEKLVRRFEKSIRKEEMSGSLRPSEMKLCITLLCTVQQEEMVELYVARMVDRERSFNFFILYDKSHFKQDDLDHMVDFAQGFLQNNYGAKNIRVSSIAQIPDYHGSIDESIRVLDFKYHLVSYDIE